MIPFISVVVCTYNREDLITGCLDSLVEQTAEPSTFEVLVIDNNSTDNTNNLVRNYSRSSNLRLISEPMQGLSYARNRGLQEAKGDYVAYLDDDARADSHYVENILKLFDQFSDTVDCFGGPILPFYTTEKPAWFKDEYETRRLRSSAGFEDKGKTFSGSNMIWKKSTLEKLGGFDPDFGVKGGQLIMGEETLLFDNLWKCNEAKLYYSPNLIVYHLVPAKKMTVGYRLSRAKAIGEFYGREVKLNEEKRFPAFLNSLCLFLKAIIKSLLRLLSFSKWQNWVVENLSPAFQEIGMMSALLRK